MGNGKFIDRKACVDRYQKRLVSTKRGVVRFFVRVSTVMHRAVIAQ